MTKLVSRTPLDKALNKMTKNYIKWLDGHNPVIFRKECPRDKMYFLDMKYLSFIDD